MNMKVLVAGGFLLSIIFYSYVNSQIQFRNMTDSCGLGNYHENGFGTALLDYDGDGDLDIFVVGQGGQNKMFRNMGDWQFQDVTVLIGVAGSGAGWGVCYGDFDADYDEDIYISRRDNSTNDFFVFSNGNYTESSVIYNVGDRGGYGYAAFFAPLTKSTALDLIVVNQAWSGYRQSCRFFQGNIDEPFIDITGTSALADSSQYWDCGAASDFDNDNDLDILISGESTNRLYKNYGNGGLTNFSDTAGINLPRDGDTTGYGITWGDYNNDGNMDYYMSYWHNQDGEMFRNNGDDTYTDVTQSLGLGQEDWCHSVSFGDFDNDGWIDLYAVTAGSGNQLYRNNQGQSFTCIDTAGVNDGHYGCGLSLGDIDWDGRLDMVVGHYHQNVDKVYAYKNITDNNNNWAIIKVNGFYPNPDAIGARVRLFAGNIIQMKEVSGGSGFGSQNMLPIHFGLGVTSIIDSLIITYPGTHIPPIKYYDLAPNQIYELPEIDIDVASIQSLSPLNYHDFQSPIFPRFRIANVGNVGALNFWSYCDLIDNAGRLRIDSLHIPYIEASDSMYIDFDPFFVSEPRRYYFLEELVYLPGDLERCNDTIANVFYAGYSHDLACGSVICPLQDSTSAPIIPAVRILNAGVTTEGQFGAACLVFLNDVIVYQEEIIYDDGLLPLLTTLIRFPAFTPTVSGGYRFLFRSNLSSDLDFSNDTAAVIVNLPVGNCTYLLGDVNNNGVFNGADVLYAAQYLNGGTPPPYSCDCPLYDLEFVAGDVNGTCTFDGIDISFMVNHFRDGYYLLPCPYCPPITLNSRN